MKILFDTNIVLDVLLNRQPFVVDAQQIWQANEDGRLDAYISATTVTDIYYFARKLLGTKDAEVAVRLCLDTFEICAVDAQVLRAAMTLPGSDFEDNVQTTCVTMNGLDAIVTRDEQGFKNANISALSPIELLQRI